MKNLAIPSFIEDVKKKKNEWHFIFTDHTIHVIFVSCYVGSDYVQKKKRKMQVKKKTISTSYCYCLMVASNLNCWYGVAE